MLFNDIFLIVGGYIKYLDVGGYNELWYLIEIIMIHFTVYIIDQNSTLQMQVPMGIYKFHVKFSD